MKLVFLDKEFEISRHYIQLFSFVFIAAFLSKGMVIFQGYTLDDYLYLAYQKLPYLDVSYYYTQGRYGFAFIISLFNLLGVNVSDVYFPWGIIVLLLHTAFIVSLLRFVGFNNSRSAALIGAIIIAHPYIVEIFTFRLMLPSMSLVLLFSIIALEALIKNATAWKMRIIASLAMLAMLFTYQIYINYFAVAIIFSFLSGRFFHKGQYLTCDNIYYQRALALVITCLVSGISFMLTLRISKLFGIQPDGRNKIIALDQIGDRIELALYTLKRIFWLHEPILPIYIKALLLIMLVIALIIMLVNLSKQHIKSNLIKDIAWFILALLLLSISLLGVGVFFTGWWPTCRLVSQISLITGFMLLTVDYGIKNNYSILLKIISRFILISEYFILFSFILLSNQILADQKRLNDWEKMMANRIIARLETLSDFNKVNTIYVSSAENWQPIQYYYPTGLHTDILIPSFFYGDVDIRNALLSEITGYKFNKAMPEQQLISENYCAHAQVWPHSESVTIKDNLAIVCLKK